MSYRQATSSADIFSHKIRRAKVKGIQRRYRHFSRWLGNSTVSERDWSSPSHFPGFFWVCNVPHSLRNPGDHDIHMSVSMAWPLLFHSPPFLFPHSLQWPCQLLLTPFMYYCTARQDFVLFRVAALQIQGCVLTSCRYWQPYRWYRDAFWQVADIPHMEMIRPVNMNFILEVIYCQLSGQKRSRSHPTIGTWWNMTAIYVESMLTWCHVPKNTNMGNVKK